MYFLKLIKKTRLLVLFILLTQFCFSQEAVFRNYNFSSGNYQLQGIYLRQHHAPNVADTISDFYINDKPYLVWCKLTWRLTNEKKYVGTYTYRIDIVKNKQIVESVWVNLTRNVIKTNRGTFEFDSNRLLNFREHLHPMGFSEYKFSSVQEGRNRLEGFVKNDSIIFYHCPWKDYDGTFSIKIPYTKANLSTEDVKKKLEKKLSKQFPNENFEVTYSSTLDFKKHSARIFEIKCSENLFLKYKKDKDEWKPYAPIIYLRIKKEKDLPQADSLNPLTNLRMEIDTVSLQSFWVPLPKKQGSNRDSAIKDFSKGIHSVGSMGKGISKGLKISFSFF